MKSLLGKWKIIPFATGLILLGFANCGGSDWKLYAETDVGNYYYDAGSLTSPSKQIVRVWTEVFHSEEGQILAMKEFKFKKKLGMSAALQEINCVDKMSRLLTVTHYDTEGITIHSESPKEPKWKYIIPDSIVEFLHKAVCK